MLNIPGSVASRVCGGGWLSGPGVPPEPGDRTSSFTAPPYDNDEEGGLCGKNETTTSEQQGWKEKVCIINKTFLVAGPRSLTRDNLNNTSRDHNAPETRCRQIVLTNNYIETKGVTIRCTFRSTIVNQMYPDRYFANDTKLRPFPLNKQNYNNNNKL